MKKNVLAAIGEALIDFIPDKTGCDFSDVTGFSPAVGGAPANVCAAFTRLGGSSRMLTQLGDDPFGRKIIRELSDCGIDTSYILQTKKANTALAFVSLSADGNRTFSFYRSPSADMLYSAENLNPAAFEDVFCLHFCSVSLGEFPMKQAHRAAIALARKSGAMVSFDPNLRFPLWEDREQLRRTVNEFIPLADVVKISDEELEFITGEKNWESGIKKLFRGNVRLVIYTCGSSGAYAYTKSTSAFSPAEGVNAADTTGAGDGFIGSFLWKLRESGADITAITPRQLEECLSFSNKFCSISVQRKGAIVSYPTLEDMSMM